MKTQIKTILIDLIFSDVLVLLTHQYKSSDGQSGERYYKHDNRLTEIPTDIPLGVVEVKILSNQLTTIKAKAFLQLSQCTYLELGSRISEIQLGAFDGLTALTNLVLNRNRLEAALRQHVLRDKQL